MGEPNYSGIFSAISEDVATVDRNWKFTSCNDRFAATFGRRRQDIVGKTPFELNPNFEQSIFYGPIAETLQTRAPAQVLGFSRSTRRWLLIRTFPFEDGLVCFASDATELDSRHHQIAQHSRRDSLTGLLNRQALEEAINARTALTASFTIVVVNLQRFKQINDILGLPAGDRALMEFAARFKALETAGIEAYRLGGDEFVCLLSGGCEEVRTVVERIRDYARERLELDGHSFQLGAAIGCASFPADGEDLATLMRRTKLAGFRAKSSSDGIVCYEPHLELEAMNTMRLEAALRTAIQQEAFHLVYQAKVDSRTSRPIGAEALVRWVDPALGPISPGEFLPLAEERKLISIIDRWVVKQAIKDLGQMIRHGLDLPVAVNFSAQTIADVSIPDYIVGLLNEHRVPARMLEIEITESGLMVDVQASASVLRELERHGVRIAVDDFGTGYSSFSYLLQLPISTLKIDRSFIQRMLDDSSTTNRAVVRGMIAIAHSMRMQVVAEGVETEDQACALRRMHCDVLQGFHFCRPQTSATFVKFLYDKLAEAPVIPDPFKL